MMKNDILQSGEKLIRVLALSESRAFVIDCKKQTMPYWTEKENLSEFKSISETELQEILGCRFPDADELCGDEKRQMREAYSSVMMIETLITASPELFQEMSREEMMDFMKRAYTFVAERVKEDNIVSAVIHLDEKTPHMHLCFVPLTKDHRLCAKEILGNRTHLSKYWQDGFFEYMHEQYPQLERGEPAAETKRKHIPVWLYKKGEHLDRMYGQVKEILDNIGMLNAKGKSKEALYLLRQWSKEGEYFFSKIKEVTGHIDGLNAEVNKWQSKYNSERRMVEQMSDYNKAANSTIEEQEYEIGRLIRQNDRYRELFDRIPDEIYEEITNTRSKNRDRGER